MSDAPSPLPRGAMGVFWALVICVLATVAYWVIWFFVNRAWLASADTPSYYAFENAFPIADGWMALASLFGAVAIQRRHASAFLWTLCAGSAALYLAGMDILFDLENGIYRAPTGDWGSVLVELVINAATLFVGAIVIAWAWRHRRELAALPGW